MATDPSTGESNRAPALPAAPPLSSPARAGLWFAGIVLPVICFGISSCVGPPFGEHSYPRMLLLGRPNVPIYPFLLYSMACLGCVLCDPEHYARRFVVRLGIYQGVLLAAQYWLLFVFALEPSASVVSTLGWALVLSALAVALPWALVRAIRYGCDSVLPWLLLIPALMLVLAALPWSILVLVVLSLPSATPWAMAAYFYAALYVARFSEIRGWRFTLAQLLAVVTLAAAYIGAWRTAVLWMLEDCAQHY